MYTGPHIIKDGLVFGYDTGYGIADNDNATRFYPGEKTTNLADTDAKRNFGAHGGNSCTTSSAPEYGPGWKKLTVTNIAGNNSRVAQLPYLTQPSGGTRTYSIEYDVTGLTGYKLKVDGTGGYSIVSIQGKGRHSATISSVSQNSSLALFLIKSGTHTNINEVVYYRYYQVEVNSHATPFVDGTRSSTASLIDLKETTDIDVSNVSFDSTGQPTFDGSDDCIDLGDSLNSIGSAATFETVFKATETNDTYRIMLGWGYGNSNYSGIHIGSWTSGYTDESFHVTFDASDLTMLVRKGHTFYKDNKYHHAVVTAGVNNYSIWIDGVEQTFTLQYGTQSTVFSNIVGYNSNIVSHIGKRPYGGGSGYFKGEIPVMKVYDRILSDDEIKQNFNAYKNRFDI
jgi:hypothetical protein